MHYTHRLDGTTSLTRWEVGGKALGLVHLLRADLPVPRAFVVTTEAYRDFIAYNELHTVIETLLHQVDTLHDKQSAYDRIRTLFAQARIPDAIYEEIAAMYVHDAYAAVAVRSSATSEDGDDASYAGQQESYLWVRGVDAVVQSIVQCWASLWNAPATIYREHRGVEHDTAAIGVIVQEMVDAEAAGVIITLDPLTGDPSQITIEGCYGLGIGLAQGELLPDRFCVDKITSELRSQSIAAKQHAYHFNPTTGDVQRLDVGVGQQMQPCITPDGISQLIQLARQIEGATGCAQDIEWAIGSLPGSSKRRIFVLQTRPETVWRNKKRPTIHYSTKRFLDTITTRLTTTRSQQHDDREDT